MNQVSENGLPSLIPCVHIPFSGEFEVCWAGPHPFHAGFCFGSTDGKIILTDEEGMPLAPPRKGSASGEAINGVAGVGTWRGGSTRPGQSFRPVLGPTGANP